MIWATDELPVRPGLPRSPSPLAVSAETAKNLAASNADRTAVDHAAADQAPTDFERAAMLVWRPLLDAEVSR